MECERNEAKKLKPSCYHSRRQHHGCRSFTTKSRTVLMLAAICMGSRPLSMENQPVSFGLSWPFCQGFQPPNTNLGRTNQQQQQSFLALAAAAKGFGAAPKKAKSKKKPTQKAIVKQLAKTYGGTSSEEIARGTQQIMNDRMKKLDEPLQLALSLYQQLQQWNFRIKGLSVLEQTKAFSPQDIQGATQAKEELDKLLAEQEMTSKDLHNLLQVMTWDASADAKAARFITGKMPSDIQKRLVKASDIVAEAVSSSAENGKCLDVGCGFGVMVPFLTKAGVKPNQIYGIDLSPEMIRNAKQLHDDDITFEAGDFFQYTAPQANDDKAGGFDAVIFCSSLHDLPDVMGAVEKAISLLNPGGKLVLLHAQGGASHVLNQVKSNPVLVPRGLPTLAELQALEGINVLVEPAAPKSFEESRDGYMAVLERA